MQTSALVMGIISLCISLGFGAANLGWVGSICGVLAIIFGAIGMKEGDASDKKRAKTGMILGIISFCWGIIVTIACIACIGAGAGAFFGAAGFFD